MFQTQPKDDKALLQQERAAMLSRNDPSAPAPVEVLDGAKEVRSLSITACASSWDVRSLLKPLIKPNLTLN